MNALTLDRAQQLVDEILCDSDGKYAPQLLELMSGTCSPDNLVAYIVMKRLFVETKPEIEEEFQRYLG
jgi:hypothetical protein